ncbi:MAG TPA: methyltransferase domain-containing protein [Candidatus Kapabacteria bacterium]|nr:methyltransferase domain-containing protein [Candidatus Kapabacteria bacterium]
MRASSLIGLTLEIYSIVLGDSRPADFLIAKFFRDRKYLGSHDRKFIAETMYAMLRHKTRLERTALTAMQKPSHGEIAGPLAEMIIYFATEPNVKLLPDFFDGVSDVAEVPRVKVEEWFQAAGSNHKDVQYTSEAERISAQHSYPQWLIEKFIAQFGESETEALCRKMNEQATVTLRVNSLKATVDECQHSLTQESIETTRGAYSPTTLVLQKRMNVFSSRTFRNGFFEVQDEGSQIVSLFCDPHPNWKVLDACAGAGGKTLHLAALMQNRGEIFALDQNQYQMDEVRKRLRRAGAQNVRVLLSDTFNEEKNRYLNTMNVVLIDAPCSGTGTIRRNPLAKWRLTEEKIQHYVSDQLSILDTYSPFVRVNGKLVYATCSVLKEENDDVVSRFLLAHPNYSVAPVKTEKNTMSDDLFDNGFLRLLPHKHNTDGFFAAAFIRNQ